MENNRGESDFQQEMEKLLFQKVCEGLQTDQLEANPTLIINQTSGIKIVLISIPKRKESLAKSIRIWVN
jgi:hypothetical protein